MFPATPEDKLASAPRRARILAQIAVSVFTLLASAAAFAQAIRYTVAIEAPRPLEKLLKENLDLLRWQGNPRLDLEQLQRLVKAAPDQARTLIATEGYYSPRVSAGLDTSGATPVARVIVDPGPPVMVADVELVLTGFAPVAGSAKAYDTAELRSRWALPVGRQFRAPGTGCRSGIAATRARSDVPERLDASSSAFRRSRSNCSAPRRV